jgi:hypothetical protein
MVQIMMLLSIWPSIGRNKMFYNQGQQNLKPVLVRFNLYVLKFCINFN